MAATLLDPLTGTEKFIGTTEVRLSEISQGSELSGSKYAEGVAVGVGGSMKVQNYKVCVYMCVRVCVCVCVCVCVSQLIWRLIE